MSQPLAGPASRFTAPIDICALSKNTAGNRRLERELLALFRDHAGSYLEGLEQATDDIAWYRAAHTLKGAARAIAAGKLAELAEDAERIPAFDSKEREILLAALRRAVQDTKRFIDFQLLDAAD